MTVISKLEIKNDEGLMSLIGKRVVLFCVSYFYEGELIGVNDRCVKLADAGIIYETGPFSDKKWKDLQKLPTPHWYVQVNAIESFAESTR